MKIVQILPELEEGGVEGETVDLAIYLANQGHQSIVISGGGRLVHQLEAAGCKHFLWPHIGEKSYRCLQYIGKLKSFLKDEHVDVLHLRSRLPAWIGYLAWKSLDSSDRPSLVTTFHGFYSVNSYSTIMTKGERVVAVSRTIRDHIVSCYRTDPKKITLIHGGFDVDSFAPENVAEHRVRHLREQWGLTASEVPVIILPGRLTQWKGQDVFIDSLAMIQDMEFVALCIGDTEENPSFTKKLREKIAGYQLQDKVRLVGHCDDMPAAMLVADLVVSASSSQPEAFGKVAIEAMAMAKPVIATAHGGSLETVRDSETGWLVEPQNPHDMAQALARALADSQRLADFGTAGRKWVSENFTAEVMCRKTIDLYEELRNQRQRKLAREQMTVLQMLPELEGGGVERGTLEMGKFLAANGHRSLVVSAGGRMVQQLETEGSEHINMKVGVKTPVCLRYIWPLRQLLQKEQVDILHLRSRMPAWVGYLAWKSLPRKQRPLLVTTFHGFYSVNAYSAIMTKGDAIIAVSQSIQNHIAECYQKTENVSLIFRGVDGNIFNPEHVAAERVEGLRYRWKLPVDKPVFMLPGRLTRLKGQDVFLKGLARMQRGNYIALLVGDTGENPGYTNELHGLIERYNLRDRVKFVGHCNDMPAAYMLADIVISASSSEPEAFGRTTAEGMAMGKPVIATAHGGSLEIVRDRVTGWLVRPGDPVAMASILAEALATSQHDRTQMGQEGRARVLAKFTTQSMCEQTLSLYRRYLAAR